MTLETLRPQAPDAILSLMAAFREDPREAKIDLGVGIYRDAEGRTPVMRAVKAAEARLLADQETKAYTGLTGDPAFAEALGRLVLGGAMPPERVAAAATPGGTGAVHQARRQMVHVGVAGAARQDLVPDHEHRGGRIGHVVRPLLVRAGHGVAGVYRPRPCASPRPSSPPA